MKTENKNINLKKIVITILSCIVIFIAFYIYNNVDKAKGEINVSIGAEPETLDPAISLTIDVRSYLSSLFEGLVNIDSKGLISDGVATKWTSNEDNTEFTFELNKDAKWSDGKAVTAEDFKYAWLRVLDPETASGWASYLYYIKGAEEYNTGKGTVKDVGIEVVDKHKLKVTLSTPCSYFASMTALQPYYPVRKDIIEKYGAEWTRKPESLISNGAYKLVLWDSDSKITVEKNKEYWNKKKIKNKTINYYLISNSSTAMNLFESGDLDYVENIMTSEEMKQVGKIKNTGFVYTKFLSINMNNVKNEKVREAIALAIDRNEMSKLMGDNYAPLNNFIPAGFTNEAEEKDFTKDSNAKDFYKSSANIEKAKEILKEANCENAKCVSKLVYLTNTSSDNVKLAEIVKSQLEKIGVRVEIQALEKKVFNSYRREKKFDIVAASWAAEYPDISSYLYGFLSTDVNNYASFKNEEYDELYNKIQLSTSAKEKYKLVHKAENLVLDSYAVIPLYVDNQVYLSNGNVENAFHDVTGCLNLVYAKNNK